MVTCNFLKASLSIKKNTCSRGIFFPHKKSGKLNALWGRENLIITAENFDNLLERLSKEEISKLGGRDGTEATGGGEYVQNA